MHQVGRRGQDCRRSRRRRYHPIASPQRGRRQQDRLLGRLYCNRRCPRRCLQTNNTRPHRSVRGQ